MHPPLHCSSGTTVEPSKGREQKAPRSKLSFRKRRGEKKKTTKKDARTIAPGDVEFKKLSSQSGAHEEGHLCGCDGKENLDGRVAIANSQASIEQIEESGEERDSASPDNMKHNRQPSHSVERRRPEEAAGSMRRREIQQSFPETDTKSLKRQKTVSIPSFSPIAESSTHLTGTVQSSCQDEERNCSESIAINDQKSTGEDKVVVAKKNDLFGVNDDSVTMENHRSKYFTKSAVEDKTAVDDGASESNRANESDNESDLPSPVFSRKLDSKGTLDNHDEESAAASLFASKSDDNEVHKRKYSNETKAVGDTENSLERESSESGRHAFVAKEKCSNNICVIEIDGSDSDSESNRGSDVWKKESNKLPGGIERAAGSPDEDIFDIPRAKKIADREKELDTRHGDLLRKLSRNPSPSSGNKEIGRVAAGIERKRRKNVKRGVCALCSTCSCSRGSALKGLEEGATDEANDPFGGFARSDSEIESALISRLKRLEKSSAWFDHLCYRVGRELRRHRCKMMKKREDCAVSGLDRPRFLADVEVGNFELEQLPQPQFGELQVNKAQHKLLGVRKNFQPTLTQMMKCGVSGDSNEYLKDGDEEIQVVDQHEHNAVSSSNALSAERRADEEVHFCVDEHSSNDTREEGSNRKATLKLDEEEIAKEDCCEEDNLKQFHTASNRRSALGVGLWEAATNSGHLSRKEKGEVEGDHEVNLFQTGERGYGGNTAPPKEGQWNGQDVAEHDAVDGSVSSVHENGLEQLLRLFQNPADPSTSTEIVELSCYGRESNQLPPFFLEGKMASDVSSELMHRGQTAFNTIQAMMLNDPARMRAIEKACPQWKDNVRFALFQNEDVVREALGSVMRSQQNLAAAKVRVLESLEQQECVLELYELSLQESLRRFGADSLNGSKSCHDRELEKRCITDTVAEGTASNNETANSANPGNCPLKERTQDAEDNLQKS